MDFRFYTNAISEASRNVAAGVFVTGLLLIGFGFLVYVLREFFAFLFAVIFCIAGIGCIATAVRIFWMYRKIHHFGSNDSPSYRENVQIHIEENYDL